MIRLNAAGDDNHYGRRLKRAREAARLTQEKLAERMDVSRVTLAKYESGRIAMGLERIETAARVLGLPTWWFFVDGDELLQEPSSRSDDRTISELLQRLSVLESKVEQQSAATARLQAAAVEARETPDFHLEEAIRRGREQGLGEALGELRGSILDVLRARFEDVPKQMASSLHSVKDPIQLRRLILEAATASTLEEFLERP